MLTLNEIGDLLNSEDDDPKATYPCSDGSSIICISVDRLAEAAYKKGQGDEHKVMIKVAVDEGNKAYKVGMQKGRLDERERIRLLLKKWCNCPLSHEEFMKEF